MGQFPAAALIYRKSLIQSGDTVATLNLNRQDLLNLKGTSLPQIASLDELRLKDIPKGTSLKPGQRLNPLLQFVGRANVNFVKSPARAELTDLSSYIDPKDLTVRSSTRELKLDYGKGMLTFDAPMAQGVSGSLLKLGAALTPALTPTLTPARIAAESRTKIQAIKHMASHIREDFAGQEMSTITGIDGRARRSAHGRPSIIQRLIRRYGESIGAPHFCPSSTAC